MSTSVTDGLADQLEALAGEHDFGGVVGVEVGGRFDAWAFGLADRAHGVANTIDHRFGIASGTKTLTAIAALSVAEDGALDLDAPVRELLGGDLPLVDDRVTARHLLHHRSGIGDYFDEDADPDVFDYAMRVPVHTLDGADGYLAALEGYPQKFEPGTDFSYCNSGYVLLGILIERATGNRYHEEVGSRVLEPADMGHTEFLRTDELPGDAAIGYLRADGLRTNVLHLPVVGFGDGGVFTTCEDIRRLWHALAEGRLGSSMLADLVAPGAPGARYGMGMWLDDRAGTAKMEGMDAGVSFASTRFGDGTTFVVLSNTAEGAWPLVRYLDSTLDPAG